MALRVGADQGLLFAVFMLPVHELGLGIGWSKILYVLTQDNINAHKTQKPEGNRPLGRHTY
jgi:hypothetical protein